MKKACCHCEYLGSYGGSKHGGTVSCKKRSDQHVSDPFEHVKTYVCDEFAPKFLTNPDPRKLEAFKVAQANGSSSLKAAIDRLFAGPPNDISIEVGRGLPMLSIADGDLFGICSIARTEKEHLIVPASVFQAYIGGIEDLPPPARIEDDFSRPTARSSDIEAPHLAPHVSDV